MKRVFGQDVLTCPRCGSRRRWIAAITDAAVIVRIGDHLALPSVPPTQAPPRAPPQLELGFEGCRMKVIVGPEKASLVGKLWAQGEG